MEDPAVAFVLGNPDQHSPALERKLHLIAGKFAGEKRVQVVDLWASLSRLFSAHYVFLLYNPIPLDLDSYLQEVPSTPSHHDSFFTFKAVDHHHQVHVRVLLPDCTITPDSLYFVVCILKKQDQERRIHDL